MLALLSNWALLILFGVILYFLVKAWRKRKAKKAKKS
jgi:preprotein translocase subunit YajC